MNDKVTVIIPVYNVEAFLEKCLNSVIEQTHRNLEIILVDDGSTDRSGQICDEYQKRDSRISVIHTTNGGQGRARNLALSRATGDWIYFVDSDDFIEAETIEKLLSFSLENKCDITRLNERYLNDQGEEIKEINLPPVIGKEECIGLLMEDKIGNYPWAGIYKAYIWDGMKFPEGRVYEDFAIMPTVYMRCHTSIGFVNEPLYNYNCHAQSTTRKKSANKHYDNFLAHKDRWDLAKRESMKSERFCFHVASVSALGAYNYYLTTNSGLAREKLLNVFSFLTEHKTTILSDPLNSRYYRMMFRTYYLSKPIYILIVSTLGKLKHH